MTTRKLIFAIIGSIAVAFVSCEKEKTEYEKQYSGDSFYGFALNNNFIIHDESISYYNADSNKVFGNLFENQNGRKLGESVHSLKFFRNWKNDYGIITVEGENMVEIVDKNFISVKQIPLYKPRNISIAWNSSDEFILISYGDAENGGIAVLTPWDISIADSVKTGNTAGEIYVHDYIYVSSNGENDTDSTIAKIYYEDSPFSLQKIDDIVVGKRPVITSSFIEHETGFSNQGILIHCLGNSVEEPKIVLLDIIKNEIISSFIFNPDEEYQERVLNFDINGNTLMYNSNNKVYLTSLYNTASTELISNANIINVIKVFSRNLCDTYDDNNYCFFSGGYCFVGITNGNSNKQKYLYRFTSENIDNTYFEVIDSVTINDNARKIVKNQ